MSSQWQPIAVKFIFFFPLFPPKLPSCMRHLTCSTHRMNAASLQEAVWREIELIVSQTPWWWQQAAAETFLGPRLLLFFFNHWVFAEFPLDHFNSFSLKDGSCTLVNVTAGCSDTETTQNWVKFDVWCEFWCAPWFCTENGTFLWLLWS